MVILTHPAAFFRRAVQGQPGANVRTEGGGVGHDRAFKKP
jgi:hypothetical protein